MTPKELAQTYSNYCAIYGDLLLKKEQIEAEINAIRSKINNLQSIKPENPNEQTTSTTKTS